MSPSFLHNHLLTSPRNPHAALVSARPMVEFVEPVPAVLPCAEDASPQRDHSGLRREQVQRPTASPSANHPLQLLQTAELRAFAKEFAFVVYESVLENLEVETKPEAIRAMVESLGNHGAIPAALEDELAAAVLKREGLGTTGIGAGVAIPHTKYPGLPRVVATLAYSRSGVEFDSLDGERVHLICLLISPSERPADHLLALQAISRQLANRDYSSWRSPKRHRGENA